MQTRFGDIDFGNGSPSAFSYSLRLAEGAIDIGWHHCGATAEFLGEIFAMRIASSRRDFNEVRHCINYLVNELLENAVKFRSPGDIVVESSFDAGLFQIRITNLIGEDTSTRFKGVLAEVTSRDPGEMLIEKLEANAVNASAGGSGLGLLTLMSDYGVRLGWTFDPAADGNATRLQTYAALKLS